MAAVVGQIYEAAYDQERWLEAVTGLRDLLGGSRSCIVRLDPTTSNAVSTVYDPEFVSSEVTAAHMRDPISVVAAALPVGKVYDRTLVTEGGAGFRRRELWQDWYRPRDMYHGLACNLLAANGSYWFFDIHRGLRQEAFGGDDVQLLQKIVPHMLRAGQIGRRLENTSALASAFSHLPFGVFLINGHQRIVQMNEAAEAMLARPDSPLALKHGVV
ncbi:PAS domain-containing protein, partial [Mesorhizobium sp. M7A.F.Ca.US.014.04.1.1]|uniref:PAS domain-containing protein n=1 Tax=Mesorhizobium sp. M7A.F.Ca.US.014.04.1.1 TaxID=2496744 RepID=UPI001FDF9A46